VPIDTTVNVAMVDFDPWQLEGTDCLSGRGSSGLCLKVTNQGIEIMGREDSEKYQ
jgi:hypothetical protein